MEGIKENIKDNPTKTDNKLRSWLKKLGLAGFLFFLVKGLVWVAIFLGAGKLFGC